MIKKVLRTIVVVLLMLLPYLPVTEFFLGTINSANFPSYLVTGSLIGLIMVLFALFIHRETKTDKSPVTLTGWLLFLLGILVLFPLHLGPPKQDQELLQFLSIERFRYGMLLLAVITFCTACYYTLFCMQSHRTTAGWIFAVLVLVAGLANLWDNYDSWSLGIQMKDWLAQGRRAEDFFPSYNFHEAFRGIARILLYMGACGLCVLLMSRNRIRRWQALLIFIFCGVGITFCVLCMTEGFNYYFPFMVPAIALAPAYWTGLALLGQEP